MLIVFVKRYKYQILLICSVLAILYPLSLFIYVPKWDNVNGYLPYRYFISDYVWNGHLPLWNPFQQLGYPGYADLQSGAWNPIVWIIMLFGKYTINSLIVELLSCYVIAGLGMFKLSKHLFNNGKVAFVLGISYALSGFMVGSSQLMVFLIAVTWFPWCIYALLQFFKTYQLKYQLLAALFMALFITGASPAYTIVLAYIVVGMFVYQLIVERKIHSNLKSILIGGAVILTSLVLLILPYINSFLEFSHYFNRGDKLEYDGFLLSNPFTPISYISFLFPDAIISKSDWFDITDLSMRNGYFGLVGLVGGISVLFSAITRTKIILLIGVVVSLLLSVGDGTFIFQYLYHLPGFGVFRHPSIFRAFTIFCLLLLAGYELKEVIENKIQRRHKIGLIAIVILIIIAGAWSMTKTTFYDVRILIFDVFDFVEFSESALSTHLLLNVIIALSLLGFSFLLKKMFNVSLFLNIAVFVLLDFAIHTRISIPTTVCYPIEHAGVSDFFNKLPNKINQEDNNTPLKKLDEKQSLIKTAGIWQNLSTYNKTISYVGVNPMRFKSFDEGKKNGALQKTIENPILFFQVPENTIIHSSTIGYNNFVAEIENSSASPKVFLLNQNYHAQWEVKYDNETLPVKKINEMIMGVDIPARSNGNIQFTYKSPRTPITFAISILAYVLMISFLLRDYIKTTSK